MYRVATTTKPRFIRQRISLLRPQLQQQQQVILVRQFSAGPLEIYQRRIDKKLVTPDPIQLRALQYLEELHYGCIEYEKEFNSRPIPVKSSTPEQTTSQAKASGGWFQSFFGSSSTPQEETKVESKEESSKIPKSLYFYGSTGCGKTYLMDLFFDNLPIKQKKRIHFHDFMIDIHKRLHLLKKTNPETEKSLQKIAHSLMEEYFLICFDEFQVTDIADAMLLKLLFEELFSKGLILVATSNRHPTELYKNGIQRDLFVPFIHMLEARSHIYSFTPSSDETFHVKDYRLVKYQHLAKNIYFSPINTMNQAAILKQFHNYCPSYTSRLPQIFENDLLSFQMNATHFTHSADLIVYGHKFHVPSIIHGRRTAKFTFQDLCNRAYGASDFIALSKLFHVICVTDVPSLSLSRGRDEMRRFITLVDALYESKSLLLVLADSEPLKLLAIDEEQKKHSTHDEIFAFDRTVSRLLEMQSTDYVKASLEAFPQGQDFLATVLPELKPNTSLGNSHHNQGHHGHGQSNPLVHAHSSTSSSSSSSSPSCQHFHNDQNSLLWVLRKIWNHYRLGTVDELQHAIQAPPSTSSSSSLQSLNSPTANESKQMISKETFFILLADIVDYYFKDMNPSDEKQALVNNYLITFHEQHAHVKFISFPVFMHCVLDIIPLVHSKV